MTCESRAEPFGTRTLCAARDAMTPLIMALPNGRILGEFMPLLQRIGIEPEPAFSRSGEPAAALSHLGPGARPDPGAQLRRRDVRRVRRGPARGRRQRRADGIRLFRDLRAARSRYRALPYGGGGAGRVGRARGPAQLEPPARRDQIPRDHPPPFRGARRAGRVHQAERRDGAGAAARASAATSSIWCRPARRCGPTASSRSSISPTSPRA